MAGPARRAVPAAARQGPRRRGPDRFAPHPVTPAPLPDDADRFGAPDDDRASFDPAAHEQPAGPQPTWARTVDSPPAAAHGANGSEPQPQPPRAVAAAPPVATTGEVSNAARLVAIEMAVGGASRADVETHLLARFGVDDPAPLLDDVFGAESHASSRLAWGEP